uniref:Uncharacterized protein n=1 Tax=Romanomermis culicivorax TaxID=13658 RepID=A0A915HFP3_ROMCU
MLCSGLRKLSTEAKGRIRLYHQDSIQQSDGRLIYTKNQPINPRNSINGDCILFQYTKDLVLDKNQGIFHRLEPDLFHNLIEKFSSTSVMKLFENKETKDQNVTDVPPQKIKFRRSTSIEEEFAQVKCSCGKICSLIHGLTSCCKKSINDVLFDVFDEMYFNANKSYAIKFENTGGDKDASPLFYVGTLSSNVESIIDQ